MENNIIWVKEDKTDNIYCCELGKAHLEATDIVYNVHCIIGCFDNIIIPRARTFKNPVHCTIFRKQSGLHNGDWIEYLREYSTGMACFDIEKLK